MTTPARPSSRTEKSKKEKVEETTRIRGTGIMDEEAGAATLSVDGTIC